MPISIKREETVRLARALKQQTGRPMARVIHEALEESLRRLSQASPDPERRPPKCARSAAASPACRTRHALGRGGGGLGAGNFFWCLGGWAFRFVWFGGLGGGWVFLGGGFLGGLKGLPFPPASPRSPKPPATTPAPQPRPTPPAPIPPTGGIIRPGPAARTSLPCPRIPRSSASTSPPAPPARRARSRARSARSSGGCRRSCGISPNAASRWTARTGTSPPCSPAFAAPRAGHPSRKRLCCLNTSSP